MIPPKLSLKSLSLNSLKSRSTYDLVYLAISYIDNWLLYPYRRTILKQIGKGVNIGNGVQIEYANRIVLNNNITIGRYATLVACSEHNPAIEIGDNVDIFPFAVLDAQGGYIKVGKNSRIGLFCVLHGNGGLEIGENVSIAAKVTVVSGNHAMRGKGISAKGIKIGDGTWIGTNASILDGVEIGKGSVIGAGAVVTKSVPEYSVAVGNPAKVIKNE
jgi:acetyltransferase-like isoleucine patch superfamily enzyme